MLTVENRVLISILYSSSWMRGEENWSGTYGTYVYGMNVSSFAAVEAIRHANPKLS